MLNAIIYPNYDLNQAGAGGFAIYPESLQKYGHFNSELLIFNSLVESGNRIGKQYESLHTHSVACNNLDTKTFNQDIKKRKVIFHNLNGFRLPPCWILDIEKDFEIIYITTIVDNLDILYEKYFEDEEILLRKKAREYAIRNSIALNFISHAMLNEFEVHFETPNVKKFVTHLGDNHLDFNGIKDEYKNLIDKVIPDNYFYIPGRAYKHKGLDSILDFIINSQVVARNNGLKFIFGGLTEEEINMYWRKKKNIEILDLCYFLGHTHRRTHKFLLSNALAVINFSLYEGFGLVYGEASREGIKTYSLNNNIIEEHIKLIGNTRIVILNEAEQLNGNQLLEIIKDSNSQNQDSLKNEQTWTACCLKLQQIYSELTEIL